MENCYAVEIGEVNADLYIAPAAASFKICPACGKKFPYYRHAPSGGRPRKFCSRVCRNRYRYMHPQIGIDICAAENMEGECSTPVR